MSEAAEKLWQCMNQRCAAVLREQELKHAGFQDARLVFCPHCGERVLQVSGPGASVGAAAESVHGTESFFGSLGQAFLYPFRGAGLFVLVAGTIALAIVKVAAAGLFIFGILLLICAYGYLAAYQFDIVLRTANGEDEPPGFPDFSEFWGDVLRPFFLVLGTVAFCFLPALLFWIFARDRLPWSETGDSVALLALLAAGIFYFPMAFLAVVMFDEIRGLNPVLVVPTILRVIVPYLVVCFFLLAVMVAESFLKGLLGKTLPVLAAYALAEFVSLYGLMVSMRLLGVLYRTHAREFGWF